MIAVSLWLLPLVLVTDAKPVEAKGHFVLVGGGGLGPDICQEFVRLAGGKDAKIVVIPSASGYARPSRCASLWQAYGARVAVLHAANRNAAADAKLYHCIDRATGVWIGGGNQGRLMYLFEGTPLADKLKALLARGGVIGGTSAGASVVTSVMVWGRGEGRGLGLLDKYIVDQHFSQRGRYGRLKRLVERHGEMVGFGIDERTALI